MKAYPNELFVTVWSENIIVGNRTSYLKTYSQLLLRNLLLP